MYNLLQWVIGWLIEYFQRQNEQFLSNIMARTNYIRWDINVYFVLNQYAKLDFYSASSLKQQFAGRHAAPHGQTHLIDVEFYHNL